MRKIRNWFRKQTAGVQVDESLTSCRAGRVGLRLIHASVIVQALTPILVVTTIIALSAITAFAQQGPSGGTIFGGNNQTLGNGVREAIKWGRNLLFLLGVGGLGWAAFNFMTEKNWAKQALGGVLCFAFGSFASL